MILRRKAIQILHRTAVTTIACFALAPFTASATTYYWDTNGSTAGIGHFPANSTFSWLTNNWSTTSFGNVAVGAWTNSSPNSDQAYFAGNAGSVVINGPLNVNSMDFRTAAYTVVGAASNYVSLNGASPSINVSLPIISGQTVINFNAPLTGSSGFTLTGNNDLGGGLKFLQLANPSSVNTNTFSGTLTIAANGAVRLGGGSLTEQIGDDTDMVLYGVIDFASNSGGKVEKMRNVLVSGNTANFSASGGTHYILNSLTATNAAGPAIALNGNNAVVTQLTINGWADGNATLTLNDGTLRFNGTGGATSTGSAANLGGDIVVTGNSYIWNQNGGGAGTATTNSFTYQNLNFTAAASTINVASGGTLNISSARAARPVVITSPLGGVTLIKTGPGDLLMTHGVEGDATFGFTGTNELREGSWTLGADERLANSSTLLVSGGTLRLQTFTETVGAVLLTDGTISGTGSATLVGSSYDLRKGYISAKLGGAQSVVKSTSDNVTLVGAQPYTGVTSVVGGTLTLQGNLASSTLTLWAGALRSEPHIVPNDLQGVNRFSTLSIAPGATLQLTNNALILDSTSSSTIAEQVRQHILAGRLTFETSDPLLRLGFGDNQLLLIDSFAGRNVSSHNNVLLKYTYAGDANLDGQVDISDLYLLAQSFQAAGLWTSGDFDYNGTVDSIDLGILARNWQAGVGNPVPGADLSSVLTSLGLPEVAIPEPACSLLLLSGAIAATQRRRRR